ncbi:hypothetical protein LCM17_07875 [Cereibacter sphaeroides]|nr:hypothetical protein [Cereibacter sphaeroides]
MTMEQSSSARNVQLSLRSTLKKLAARGSSSHATSRSKSPRDQLAGSWFEEEVQPATKRAEPKPIDPAAFASSQSLQEIWKRSQYRFPKHSEQPDLLADPATFDTQAATLNALALPSSEPSGNRRDMRDQFLILQRTFGGRPEILFWNALAISYLRRETPHTAKARSLFFKIWDEQPAFLCSALNGRWLISSLQTFADHGRFPEEINAGTTGFMYGNLIKIYEAEIASAYTRNPNVDRFRGGTVDGFFGFQPGDDILLNINTFAIQNANGAGSSGMALMKLLAIVKQSSSIFSRTDALAAHSDQPYYSFGEPPSEQ